MWFDEGEEEILGESGSPFENISPSPPLWIKSEDEVRQAVDAANGFFHLIAPHSTNITNLEDLAQHEPNGASRRSKFARAFAHSLGTQKWAG
jgi:hypothetical protein